MAAVEAPEKRADPLDRRLVVDAIAGDADAIDMLIRKHWPAMRRIAFLLTQDPSSAEDIAQEAMLSALTALPGFDPDRPLEPWLARITTNRSIDWLRRRSAREESRRVDGLNIEDVRLVAETADAMRGALSADVSTALRGLAPQIRTAVVLRHLLDYEPAEIGELTGVPASTIRSRIHRGLLSLRNELTRREGGDR